MINADFLNDLARRLTEALPPSLKLLKKDLEKNFHAVLQSAFQKLDLVTRDEFDTQARVLERARKRLTELEKSIHDLETKMGKKKRS
ncbi:MAG: accessory factor UbiK family protein [Gammaproteobacteria bacterium]|nr:accessory factor UbiK family protein [Gammaproteobacteria bacterium]